MIAVAVLAVSGAATVVSFAARAGHRRSAVENSFRSNSGNFSTV
jgi:hypothetical protein